MTARVPTWSATVAGIATGCIGVVLLVLGLGMGRADVAVIGVPLAAAVMWGWLAAPTRPLIADRGGLQQDGRRLSTTIALDSPPNADPVRIRLDAPGYRTSELLLAGGAREIRATITTRRTGRLRLFGLSAIAAGPFEVTRSEPVTVDPIVANIMPRSRRLREVPLPFRLQGMTGPHGSRRLGDGGDLRDINLFVSGDRLRRIDWRVTARRAGSGGIGELYVRRTFAVADAVVVLVIDSRDEVGPDVSSWSDSSIPARADEATSLDATREAALSIARQFIETGDRVGMQDLGRSRAEIAPGAGRRHLQRLAERLALAEPEGEPVQRVRAPLIPSGAFVVLFSTFLDDEAALVATQWRRAGHRVLGVDTLPDLRTDDLSDVRLLATEMVLLERTERLADLARVGVELIRWSDSPTPAVPTPERALLALARQVRRR